MAKMTDSRVRRMRTLATQIRGCTACAGMNIPEVTQAAPGYGSAHSPVVIVGQSLCGPCMATQIPFTGGSGRFLEVSKRPSASSFSFSSSSFNCRSPTPSGRTRSTTSWRSPRTS